MTSNSIYVQKTYAPPTQNQIDHFKPTFLYIKRCKVTGLLYFGKTVSKYVETYTGSGKYWICNFKKYGRENIETIWYCLFTDIFTLQEFALTFSKQQNIIESELWANLTYEDGLSGVISEATREKARLSAKGRVQTPEDRLKKSIAHKNKPVSQKSLDNLKLCRSITKEQWDISAEWCRKWWCFTDPDGNEHITKYFKKFCIDNDLKYESMCNQRAGQQKHVKGWTAKKYIQYDQVKSKSSTLTVLELEETPIEEESVLPESEMFSQG